MAQTSFDLDALLILSGLVVILISLFLSCRLLQQLKHQKTRGIWLAMVVLVAAFVIGYAAMLFSRSIGYYDALSKLTALILFLGSLFVFLSVNISRKMNGDLQNYVNNLENLVDERTAVVPRFRDPTFSEFLQ